MSSPTCLSGSIRRALRTGWPIGGPVDYTICLAEFLQDDFPDQPALIQETRRLLPNQPDVILEHFWGMLEDGFIEAVYGSNLIEHAGTTLDITQRLCRMVFRGQAANIVVDERSEEYQQGFQNLVSRGESSDKASVYRSRAEVVQHAQALNFLIVAFVLGGKPLTEALILQCHAMLYAGITDEDGNSIAGVYRKDRCAVSYGEKVKKKNPHEFIRPQAIPHYMRTLVHDFQMEIADAEVRQLLDPYELAARYHHRFVNIHPFADGNGRLSRIILNVILLKYAGHVSPIGCTDEEVKDYLSIAARGGREFHKEDMEVDQRDFKGHHELARYALTKSKGHFERMADWCKTAKRPIAGPGSS